MSDRNGEKLGEGSDELDAGEDREAAWLLARQRGDRGPDVPEATAKRFARLESMIKELPAMPAGLEPRLGWEQRVLAAIDAQIVRPRGSGNIEALTSLEDRPAQGDEGDARGEDISGQVIAAAEASSIDGGFRDADGVLRLPSAGASELIGVAKQPHAANLSAMAELRRGKARPGDVVWRGAARGDETPGVLVESDASSSPPSPRPQKAQQRLGRWFAPGSAFVAAAAIAMIVIIGLRTPRDDQEQHATLAYTVDFGPSRMRSDRRLGAVNFGDTIQFQASVSRGGEIRVYDRLGQELARCPSSSELDCNVQRRDGRTTLDLRVVAMTPGEITAVLFSPALEGPSGRGFDSDLAAATDARIDIKQERLLVQ